MELEWKLGKKAKDLPGKTLPERDIIEALEKMGGNGGLPEIAEVTGLENKVIGQSLRWLVQKKWAEKNGKNLKILSEGQSALQSKYEDEKLIALLMDKGGVTSG